MKIIEQKTKCRIWWINDKSFDPFLTFNRNRNIERVTASPVFFVSLQSVKPFSNGCVQSWQLIIEQNKGERNWTIWQIDFQYLKLWTIDLNRIENRIMVPSSRKYACKVEECVCVRETLSRVHRSNNMRRNFPVKLIGFQTFIVVQNIHSLTHIYTSSFCAKTHTQIQKSYVWQCPNCFKISSFYIKAHVKIRTKISFRTKINL